MQVIEFTKMWVLFWLAEFSFSGTLVQWLGKRKLKCTFGWWVQNSLYLLGYIFLNLPLRQYWLCKLYYKHMPLYTASPSNKSVMLRTARSAVAKNTCLHLRLLHCKILKTFPINVNPICNPVPGSSTLSLREELASWTISLDESQPIYTEAILLPWTDFFSVNVEVLQCKSFLSRFSVSLCN